MSDELGNKNAKSFGGLSSLKKFAAVGGAKNESSENQKTKNVDSKMQIQEALNKIGVQKVKLIWIEFSLDWLFNFILFLKFLAWVVSQVG